MVEKNTRRSMQSKRLTVIDCNPMPVELGDSIRATWVEWCRFTLGNSLNFAKHFGCRRLIETNFGIDCPNRFENTGDSQSIYVCGVQWLIKRGAHKALSGKIIKLVGLNFVNSFLNITIFQQLQGNHFNFVCDTHFIQTPDVCRCTSAICTVHLVPFL